MAVTFMQMAEEAMSEVDGATPEDIQQKLDNDPEALIVDVRDAAEISSTGLAARGINISLGNLPVKADLELPEDWRDSRLQDRARLVVTTCQTGENASRAAKLLKDMGFENVYYMAGGMEAWNTAGLPTA